MENAPGFPYEFKNAELAASCRTRAADGFERLEWLGDRVLGCAIAHLLHQHYLQHRESKLTLSFNRLVANTNLSKHARLLGVAQPSDTRRRAADILEAHLGAVMLDGGWDAAYACVERIFGEQIRALSSSSWQRDPKSRLKEYAEKRVHLPEYKYVETDGGFAATCSFKDKQTTGTGRSKKEAAHVAATDMLAQLQAEEPEEQKVEENA